jgi:hypothetical protein
MYSRVFLSLPGKRTNTLCRQQPRARCLLLRKGRNGADPEGNQIAFAKYQTDGGQDSVASGLRVLYVLSRRGVGAEADA